VRRHFGGGPCVWGASAPGYRARRWGRISRAPSPANPPNTGAIIKRPVAGGPVLSAHGSASDGIAACVQRSACVATRAKVLRAWRVMRQRHHVARARGLPISEARAGRPARPVTFPVKFWRYSRAKAVKAASRSSAVSAAAGLAETAGFRGRFPVYLRERNSLIGLTNPLGAGRPPRGVRALQKGSLSSRHTVDKTLVNGTYEVTALSRNRS